MKRESKEKTLKKNHDFQAINNKVKGKKEIEINDLLKMDVNNHVDSSKKEKVETKQNNLMKDENKKDISLVQGLINGEKAKKVDSKKEEGKKESKELKENSKNSLDMNFQNSKETITKENKTNKGINGKEKSISEKKSNEIQKIEDKTRINSDKNSQQNSKKADDMISNNKKEIAKSEKKNDKISIEKEKPISDKKLNDLQINKDKKLPILDQDKNNKQKLNNEGGKPNKNQGEKMENRKEIDKNIKKMENPQISNKKSLNPKICKEEDEEDEEVEEEDEEDEEEKEYKDIQKLKMGNNSKDQELIDRKESSDIIADYPNELDFEEEDFEKNEKLLEALKHLQPVYVEDLGQELLMDELGNLYDLEGNFIGQADGDMDEDEEEMEDNDLDDNLDEEVLQNPLNQKEKIKNKGNKDQKENNKKTKKLDAGDEDIEQYFDEEISEN